MDLATAFMGLLTWSDVVGDASWELQPWAPWIKAKQGRNMSFGIPLLPKSGGSLAECAAGNYDAYWAKLANNLANYGFSSAYLRLGFEMDGNWFAWGAPPGSGKEASFAGCFRRAVQVMRQTQPNNKWKFVFNTAPVWNLSRAYLDATWPGDAYVDVVAVDLYNQSGAANTYPYPSSCDATCRLTRQQNAWQYLSKLLYIMRDFALAHGKTMALPEWGTGTRPDGLGGGDAPYYIQQMYDFINDPANKVEFYSYFDINGGDVNAQLSPTTNFPESSALYKKLFSALPASPNSAPAVSLTAPLAGQTVSGTVSFAANASDDGGVTRVDFFVDSTGLLSDSTAPYGGSLDTTKLANGTHVLKALAYDAQGLSATAQVSINVQNALPYAGTPYSGTPIAVPVAFEAESFDKGGEGVAYHDLTAGNSGGQYRTAESVDIIASSDSAGGGYVVNNFQTGEWLAYTINVPAGGKYDISVRASNNYASPTAFHVEVDGTNVTGAIPVPNTGSWSTFQWVGKQAVDITAGKHVLKLVADAQYFNVNMLSVLTSATATPTTGTGPSVSFSAPSAGATLSGAIGPDSSACEVTGTGISRVMFFMDGTQLNTETYAPWNCAVDTRLFANGTHALKAVAYNSAGAATTITRSVNIQNGPTVTFKAPAAGATLSGAIGPDSSACEVAGTGISRVVFFMDGTQLNTESYAPWNCAVDTRLFANGTHTLKAMAFDSAGAATTVTQSVTVQNGPVVAFKAPSAGAVLSGAIGPNSSACEVAGTGISRVVFYMDSKQLNTESYTPWNCTFDTRVFANGSHVLKAIAYDSSGGATTVTQTVKVQN